MLVWLRLSKVSFSYLFKILCWFSAFDSTSTWNLNRKDYLARSILYVISQKISLRKCKFLIKHLIFCVENFICLVNGKKEGPNINNYVHCKFNFPQFPMNKTTFILGISKELDEETVNQRRNDLKKIKKYLIRQSYSETPEEK